MGRRRLLLAVLAALGLLVALGAPTAWLLTRPAKAVRADVAEALAATSAPAAAEWTTPAAPSAPAVPTQEGRLGAGSRAAIVVPIEIQLPKLDVTSRLVSIGVERDGELEIPEDVQTVGWYRYGPRPGDRQGSIVMSGHVDSAEQGKGAFFQLGRLRPGDPVVVRTSDGKSWRYRVVAREEWPKTEVPLDRIFARGGAPRLTLVTCGGGFREDIRSYQDNVAVTAVPEDG
jgi:hypothetical protein